MPTTLELMKADHTDSQGDQFSEVSLKAVAKAHRDNPSFHRFVTRGFGPTAKSILGISDITYSCGALLVTLEGEAEEIVKAERLVAAAGGHMDVAEVVDGVRHYDSFQLDRVALVKPEDKVE